MQGGGGAPTPPNAQALGQQQYQTNVQTGIANAVLGNTNQVTPYGSLSYKQTGGQWVGDQFVPSYTATQTLSPEEQQIFQGGTALQTGALGLAPGAISAAGRGLSTPLPADQTTAKNEAYNALTARTTQALDLQQKQQATQLMNQGIQPGSEAWDNAMRPIEQARVDAANQATINAGNVAGQNIAQAIQLQQAPLQNLTNIQSIGGGVTQPTYAPATAATIPATDIVSPAYASYQGQLQQYNTNQANQGSLFGSLGGLAGTLGGAALLRGLPAGVFSDERLKDDVKKVGELDDGQKVYSYRYKGDPRTQIGLLAHEVEKKHPEAVATHPSGYKMVDYHKATKGLFGLGG